MKPLPDYINITKRQPLDRLTAILAGVVTVLFVAAIVWGR
jgi:hypothetical protein